MYDPENDTATAPNDPEATIAITLSLFSLPSAFTPTNDPEIASSIPVGPNAVPATKLPSKVLNSLPATPPSPATNMKLEVLLADTAYEMSLISLRSRTASGIACGTKEGEEVPTCKSPSYIPSTPYPETLSDDAAT